MTGASYRFCCKWAKNNAHKIREIKTILSGRFEEILSLREAGIDHETVEDGVTFAENALIKARAASKTLGCIALADDSGLCVDALGGAPGVYSARYCGRHGDDTENRRCLLSAMQGVEDRTAYFAAATVIVYPDGKEIVATGETYGRILHAEDGEGGFGYDPLFFSDDLQKSFGVATAEEKNAVSHRARALEKLLIAWEKAENE